MLIFYEYAFPESDDEQKEMDELRLHALVNFATCCVKLSLYDEALDHCSQALYADADNVKALYRRAQCFRHKDKFVESRKDIERALELSPDDAQLRRERALLGKAMRDYAVQRARVAKAMFDPSNRDNATKSAGVVPVDEEGHLGDVEGNDDCSDDDGDVSVGLENDAGFITSAALLQGGAASCDGEKVLRHADQGNGVTGHFKATSNDQAAMSSADRVSELFLTTQAAREMVVESHFRVAGGAKTSHIQQPPRPLPPFGAFSQRQGIAVLGVGVPIVLGTALLLGRLLQ